MRNETDRNVTVVIDTNNKVNLEKAYNALKIQVERLVAEALVEAKSINPELKVSNEMDQVRYLMSFCVMPFMMDEPEIDAELLLSFINMFFKNLLIPVSQEPDDFKYQFVEIITKITNDILFNKEQPKNVH